MALVVFFVAAVVASSLADLVRARTQQAELRRREADLTAELARLLLGAPTLEDALPAAGQRLAEALELREQPQGADAFRVSIHGEIPLIHGDAAQLERALGNLLENAVRYSAPEPVLVRIRRMGRRVMIRVVDRGPGLAYGEHERVFEPFYRGKATDAGDTGSGLGLAIVRGFVKGNGGKVWAESLPGQGTTFVVELPIEPATVPAEAQPT